MDSDLTMGGAYVTRETKTSFKGYYRVSKKQDDFFLRTFIQFDGEGEAANARQREIGGHPAELLRNVCLRKDPHSSHADRDGYVPFGQLEEYANGRSNGCTSWSPSEAGRIIGMKLTLLLALVLACAGLSVLMHGYFLWMHVFILLHIQAMAC